MHGILVRWLIVTFSIMVAAYLIDGIVVEGFFSALFAAAVLGFLNAFLRPILLILTLPLNILTLGLFTFVINAMLLSMASGLIGGFHVFGFWSAIWGALVISIVNWIVNSIISDRGRIEIRRYHHRDDTIDLERRNDGRWE